jgi:hypothetical protein
MSMATLVAMVNELGGTATMKTFSQRSKAVERVNKLAGDAGVQLDQFFNEDGSKRVIEAEVDGKTFSVEVPLGVVPTEGATAHVDAPKDLGAGVVLTEPHTLVETPLPNGPTSTGAIDHGDIDWDKVPVTVTVKDDEPKPETDPNWPFKQHESQLKEAEQAEQAKPVEKPKAPKKEPRVSIRVVAEAKLMEVVSIDEGGRKVGLSYAEILDYLHANFQGSKTTVACLRWYAAHMRDRGTLPPNRPRAVPKKAEPQVAESANDSQTSEAA